MRPIQATVSLSALAHNLAVAKRHAPQSKMMAVVKANGYGHGLLNVAAGLSAADGFAVLNLSEAIDLREAGYDQVILLLEGAFSLQELKIASSYGVDVVTHSMPQLEMLEKSQLLRPIHIYLKMNSGMNRLGFQPHAYEAAYQRAQACKNVRGITFMTHFATADEEVGVASALDVFNQTTADMTGKSSLANSAAILRHPQTHVDWVRPGIMLYGSTPVSSTPAAEYDLKPAMQFTSEIIAIQEINAGESVGYGNRFIATKPTRVGVVACGYADGYPRHAPNGTPISVAGKLTNTMGRVSMDMLFADLTDIPEANIGTPVELWGNQVPVDAVAEKAGTVGYELLCAVAPRVPMRVVD